MRLRYFIFIILTLVIVLNACTPKSTNVVLSEELIIANVDDIKTIQIDRVHESSKLITDKEIISKIYKLLSGINMEILSVNQETSLMQSNMLSYSLIFMSEQKVVGSIMIFSSGDIIFIDTNTAITDKRTVSYIHYKLDNQKLLSILEQMK